MFANSPLIVFSTLLLLALCAPGASGDTGNLRINELLADNTATIADELGEYDDWIEILNTGAVAVSLAGLFLTDDAANTTQWTFPDTLLPAGAYLIVWADNDVEQGPLHTTFKLSAGGEFIGLYASLGQGNGVIDSTSFGNQYPDIAYGRSPNGAGPFGYQIPTPGLTNGGFINTPPVISETAHYPALPREGNRVTVTTRITDDSAITGASLYFGTGGGYTATPLFDDGAHDDGEFGDHLYGGFIPGQFEGTTVSYYVQATDDSAAVITDPLEAPATTYAYEVGAYLPPQLFINEFMASNATTITDIAGEYDDWVEIYNGGAETVELAGYHLSDDPADPQKFIFPNLALAAGEFLLIWCDDDIGQGPLHAPFKLSADGEFIGLYDRVDHATIVIDSLSFGVQLTDISLGRETDGAPIWISFTVATPGFSNQSSAVDESDRPDGPVSALLAPVIQRGEIRLAFTRDSDRPIRCELFDLSGRRRLSTVRFAPAGEVAIRLATDGLATGAYFLRLQSGATIASGRILLIH